MESRKLAAVMFTDIEGSTSMFHRDEAKTMELIQQHRQNLERIISARHGQIMKFYCDGSLIVFDSVIDAVCSATEIQQISRKENLPIRIGIHLGDLLIKDGDVYGDVVNMSSRLQTIGTPGSVVVSRKVKEELSNHPEMTTVRLGFFELKNIKEPQELFAISGHGLSIPDKRIVLPKKSFSILWVGMVLAFLVAGWFLIRSLNRDKLETSVRKEKIAIPPFENFTTDQVLGPIGQMAAHWITTELIELAEANVVSYPSSSFHMVTSEASIFQRNQFARQTGAIHIIKGAYSYSGVNSDSLVFWANIINSTTGEILPIEFAKSYCKSSDPLTCIRELSNEIKGFWKSKNDQVLSPPKYDAYLEYLRARHTWDGADDSIPESHLRKAIMLDPNFIDAYFLLLDLFYNRRTPGEASDSVQAMRIRFKNLTPRQENYLRYHEEDLKGRRAEAFRLFMNEYNIDRKDIFVNTSGMVMALTYLNDPDKVISFHEEINMDSLDLKSCSYCLERVLMLLQAYMKNGDMKKAKSMAQKVAQYAATRDDFHRLFEFYLVANDTASINQLLTSFSKNPLDKDYRYLAFVAGRQAQLTGNNALRDYYARKAVALYATDAPSRALGRAYDLLGDGPKAEKIFKSLLNEEEVDNRLYADIGLVYARKGDATAANEIIDKLEEIKEAFDFGETAYLQGRIKAVLGEKEAAIQLLEKSLEEGQLFFNSVTFDGDPDLVSLHREDGYKRLLSSRKESVGK